MSKRHITIADTQCKPNHDLSYMSSIGQYIADKRPDVIIHIGDHYDFESLSIYDKGKKSFEGRRLIADIEAGNKGMELLLAPIKKLQQQQRRFRKKVYNPRMIFCTGNHEQRFDRLSNDMPELDGFVGTETLNLEKYGWEVYPFLKPVEVDGIFYVHYLANPFSGKPYGGNALSQLKTVGRSFVVGHKQLLDMALHPTLDGNMQIGIINGACLTPDHKVLTADLRYVELGSVKVGDQLVSVDEQVSENNRRRFKTGTVTGHKIEKDLVFEVLLSDGKVFKVTDDHRWLVKTGSSYLWKETNQLRVGTRVVKALDEWAENKSYDAGWLSGIYDGEGTYGVRHSGNSVCARMAVYQKEGLVLDKMKSVLMNELGMENSTSVAHNRNCVELKVKGGVKEIAKLLGTLRPIRLLDKFKPEHLGRLKTTDDKNPHVVSIKKLGEMDIVRIAIDEKTMIVEGFVHHNCYPFDEDYKGFQGNNHFRGVMVLNEVENGFGLPMPVSLEYLMKKYPA